ncbi:formylglycine-generating enzyme family protein [Thalassotalea atypica]|uniref:formylglycine-generating enzyme family protein n=1 Tax=Thalassotalea atypica TaxID=2054316 RepID=UPI00257224F2|nr:SUMF1/EgtB/PvdO family nonheme iron enzyme [Thalassotalea atypica]
MKILIPTLMIVLLQSCALTKSYNNELREQVLNNMILVDGGTFDMGSSCEQEKNCDHVQHQVTVDSFYIGKFEVTQQLFESVLGSSSSYFPGDEFPVNYVSWQQVKYFLSKLNEETGLDFRLPTEAEWEFAARGGTKSKDYVFSGSNDIETVGWYAQNANNKAHAVGLKAPNELGLYDMTGNVGELVEDAFDVNFYKHSPKNNPVNSIASKHPLAYKSVRGGSFSYDGHESENFRRDSASQSALMPDIGFRLAMSK